MEGITYFLLILLVAQGVIHHLHTQKLVNKIMSVDYREYKIAQSIQAVDQTKALPLEMESPGVDPQIQELNSLM